MRSEITRRDIVVEWGCYAILILCSAGIFRYADSPAESWLWAVIMVCITVVLVDHTVRWLKGETRR